jgi:phosphatidylserine/phosphatidylglycerophosphate/cardiolipin synthase-like enzyme
MNNTGPDQTSDLREKALVNQMRRIDIVLLLLAAWTAQAVAAEPSPPLPPIEVHFSPRGGCTEAVVKELNAARASVLVQTYFLTSAPIAKALVEAHRRGVQVQVILDKSQRTEKHSEADFLVNVGIPTRIDAQHALAHNTITIIDGQVVVTGSFTLTKNAEENNAENLLVIRSSELAAKYTANWQAHAAHSEPYAGRERGYPETVRPSNTPSAAGEVLGGFVVSKNSQVFHRPDCKLAAKISAKNLVRFPTREAAIQAGMKPCQECSP